MKSIMRIALLFICLIPACGGKAEDDHAMGDTGAISSVGGSSQDETGGTSNATTSTTAWTSTGGSTTVNATGGSSAVQTTSSTGGASSVSTTSATTGGTNGILHLLEPTARELPDRTVVPGQTDVTVFEFTLSAEQRNIRVPRMYVDVTGSIKNDELMPVTIVDEANNVVATENPTPFGDVYTFGEYGGAFWFSAFTVDASAPPKTFRVKTGIEQTAQVGKTFRFGIDTSTNVYPMVDDPYLVEICNLGIYGSRFTVVENPNTNNGTGGSTSVSATGGTSSTGGTTSTSTSTTSTATGGATSTSTTIASSAWIWTEPTTNKSLNVRDTINFHVGSYSPAGIKTVVISLNGVAKRQCDYDASPSNRNCNVTVTGSDYIVGTTVTFTTSITPYVGDEYRAPSLTLQVVDDSSTTTGGASSIGGDSAISTGGSTSNTDSPLVVSLSKDIPASQIIVSGPNWGSWYVFSDYVVKNKSTVPQTIAPIAVSGSIADFITINVSVCGNNHPAGGGLSIYAPNSHIYLEDGDVDPWHPNTSAHFVDDTSLVFDFTQGTARTILDPNEELHLCVTGLPSAVRTEAEDIATPGRDPRSGDRIYLKISDLTNSEGTHALIEDPNPTPACSSAGCVMAAMAAFKPSLMTLRKAKPIVSILPLPTTTLVNGQNTLFKFKIATDSNGGPIKFAQFSVKYEKMSHLTISNLRVFKDNVQLTNEQETRITSYTESDEKGEFTVTLNKETIIDSNGAIYALVGDVTSLQNGDTLLTRFRRTGFVVSQTGSICRPSGSTNFLITDASTCIANSPEFMSQGSFLWSDMSDPINNKDWTDDFLVESLDGSSVLTY